jgi:hypothetical protein
VKGRLASPVYPSLPPELAGWYWQRDEYGLQRLWYVATGYHTPWSDEDLGSNVVINAALRYLHVTQEDEVLNAYS